MPIFNVNDTVYVPATKVGISDSATALKRLTVAAVNGRSITVATPGGGMETVGSKLAHKDVSLLICRIGDYETEHTLLNPLTKSLLQFCRLLLPDDQLKTEHIRSREDFCFIWNRDHAAYSHVILIGHCNGREMTFGTESVSASEFSTCFLNTQSNPKDFISLACHSGKSNFAKAFSEMPVCKTFLAPFQACHGAVASQFCQTLLTRHFLEGMTLKSAFNNSCDAPGGTSFRFWRDGIMC